jgi:serine/threonine-protein kinase RsbW
MTLAWHIVREFRADLGVLASVRGLVHEAVLAGGFPEMFCNRLQIAVDEAVTNIVEHGYRATPPDQALFRLRIDSNPEEFRIEICDHGVSHDLGTSRLLDIRQHVAEGRPGGLGIYLIQRIMDQVDYHAGSGARNRLVMIKRAS